MHLGSVWVIFTVPFWNIIFLSQHKRTKEPRFCTYLHITDLLDLKSIRIIIGVLLGYCFTVVSVKSCGFFFFASITTPRGVKESMSVPPVLQSHQKKLPINRSRRGRGIHLVCVCVWVCMLTHLHAYLRRNIYRYSTQSSPDFTRLVTRLHIDITGYLGSAISCKGD